MLVKSETRRSDDSLPLTDFSKKSSEEIELELTTQ